MQPVRIFDPRQNENYTFDLTRGVEVSTLAHDVWVLEARKIDWRPYADLIDALLNSSADFSGQVFGTFLPWGPRSKEQKAHFRDLWVDSREFANGTVLCGQTPRVPGGIACGLISDIATGILGTGLWTLGSIAQDDRLVEFLSSDERFVESPSFLAAALLPYATPLLALDDGVDYLMVKISSASAPLIDELVTRIKALP